MLYAYTSCVGEVESVGGGESEESVPVCKSAGVKKSEEVARERVNILSFGPRPGER